MPFRPLLLLLLLLLLICSLSADALRMELVHRESLGGVERGAERMRELLRHDVARYSMILRKRGMGRRKLAVEMRMEPGRDYGVGQYLAEVRVGTPAQKFRVLVDTGSDLTWIKCTYNANQKNRTKTRTRTRAMTRKRRVFNAHLSASFRTVPCSSQLCKIDLMDLFSLSRCPTLRTPCAYDYRYLDGSSAVGIFGRETLTLGLTDERKARLRDVLIGCTDSSQGQSLRPADGVLGMANSKFSFAAKAAETYGGKFSYCLVDHLSHRNVSNYLIFGSNQGQKHRGCLLAPKRRTQLELGLVPPFYAVNVIRISIGDQMLNIPREVWEARRGGGTVLDSGTSLTFLAEPAYRSVMSALTPFVSKYERVKVKGVPMEYCFNSSGGYEESVVPKMTFHFADGGRFEPHRKSYVIEADEGVKCLGFLSAGSPGTNVIGNIMQQNYLWEFDTARSELSFAPSRCT